MTPEQQQELQGIAKAYLSGTHAPKPSPELMEEIRRIAKSHEPAPAWFKDMVREHYGIPKDVTAFIQVLPVTGNPEQQLEHQLPPEVFSRLMNYPLHMREAWIRQYQKRPMQPPVTPEYGQSPLDYVQRMLEDDHTEQ